MSFLRSPLLYDFQGLLQALGFHSIGPMINTARGHGNEQKAALPSRYTRTGNGSRETLPPHTPRERPELQTSAARGTCRAHQQAGPHRSPCFFPAAPLGFPHSRGVARTSSSGSLGRCGAADRSREGCFHLIQNPGLAGLFFLHLKNTPHPRGLYSR